MQTVSERYKALLAAGARKETKAVIAGETYGEDRLNMGGVSVTSSVIDDKKRGKRIGNCTSSILQLSISSPGTIPRMAEINLYIRLVGLDDSSEWIPKGTYFIDERSYDESTGTLNLIAYDPMLKTEQPFTTTGDQGGWPMTDRAVVDEVCARIGVTLDARTAAILTKGYAVQYPGYGVGAYTMREVLGYVGAMYAGNWIISDAGELRLIVLGDIPAETNYIIEEHGDAITLGGVRLLHTPVAPAAAKTNTTDKTYLGMNVSKLDTAPAFDPYSKVIVTVDQATDENGNTVDLVYTAGDDTGRALKFDCPWGTQQIADDVLAQIRGYAYRPYTATGALLDPAAELGDGVTVDGLYSVIAAIDVTFDALYTADISAPGDEEVDHEFPYVSSPQRAIERKIAEVNTSLSVLGGKIEGKISSSDAQTLISQDLNSITLSAVGGANSATLTLTANGITAKAANIYFSSITADSIVANSKITSPRIYGGKYYAQGGIAYQQLSYGNSYGYLDLFHEAYSGDSPIERTTFSYDHGVTAVSRKIGDITYMSISDNGSDSTFLYLGGWRCNVVINSGDLWIGGPMILESECYGTSLPASGKTGQLFFLI